MKYLYLIPIFFFFPLNLNSQWYYQNPIPTGDLLINVDFPSDSIGYAIGKNSCIIKTVDAGNSWNIIKEHEVYNNLDWMFFINDSIGYICGNNYFAKTNDGGNNWEIPISIDGLFTSVYFLNENIGFLTDEEGNILKTNNGGINWSTQQIDYPLELNSIEFVNNDTGYCVGSLIVGLDSYEGKIYKTKNCGESWFEINTNNIFSGHLRKIKFLNENKGIALGDYGRILYTENNGADWQQKQMGDDISLRSLCYMEPNLSLIIGFQENESVMLKSTDFFETWDSNVISSYSLYSLTTVGNARLCAVGINGTILISENFGEDWDEISTNIAGASNWQTFRSVNFSDTLLGMIVGEKGRIIKTTDSGEHWELLENGLEYVLFSSSHFINADTIITTSYNGIYKSTDGGVNWTKINDFLTKDLVFLDENLGYAVGKNKLYKSQNGGEDWILFEQFEFGENVSEIQFLDDMCGYILGSHEIFKTIDGGDNWAKIEMNNSDPLKSFCFTDNDFGFVIDDSKYLYKTFDGGNSWSKFDLGYYGYNSIKFRNNVGIIVGNQYILKTEDGGESWMIMPNVTHNPLKSIDILPNGHAFAVGRGFTILKTDNYGGIGEIIDIPVVLTSIELESNDQISIYPNPTSNKIVISCNLSAQPIDNIRIVNIVGKTIMKIEIKKKYITNQKIILNLANEPPGIYFCVITLNEKNEVYKILKI